MGLQHPHSLKSSSSFGVFLLLLLVLILIFYKSIVDAVWLRKLKLGLYINLEGWDREADGKEVQKGGDICIPIVDSLCSTAETNTLLSNYTPVKIKLFYTSLMNTRIYIKNVKACIGVETPNTNKHLKRCSKSSVIKWSENGNNGMYHFIPNYSCQKLES